MIPIEVDGLRVVQIDGRQICVRGIGKFYTEVGLPINITIEKMKNKGLEVSLYHLVEELFDMGFNAKRIANILISELDNEHDKSVIIRYLESTDKEKLQLIQDFMFLNSENALKWLRKQLLTIKPTNI